MQFNAMQLVIMQDNADLIRELLQWFSNLASSGVAHVILAASDSFFPSFLHDSEIF